ncbi:MAG: hypothetical protein OEM63_00865 [Gammaproteobacteria bacterium]|nr:hypothetical protein [Gammaproteobacteria bacterium]
MWPPAKHLKKSNWRDVAELVGITAIVASLVFVGMQLRQDRQIANSDSLVAEQILNLEIAALIDQRRDVWRKGVAGEDLTADEKVSFDLMAYSLFRQQANDFRNRFEHGENAGMDLVGYTYAFFRRAKTERQSTLSFPRYEFCHSPL